MSRYERTVTFDIEDFYRVVTALREACGCADCLRTANDMLAQSRKQVRA